MEALDQLDNYNKLVQGTNLIDTGNFKFDQIMEEEVEESISMTKQE